MQNIAKFAKAKPLNYASPNQPFPMNRFYVPKQPLSQASKDTVVELAKTKTPNETAVHLRISTVRVNAILKLAALARKIEADGGVLQVALQKGMDAMLGAVTVDADAKDRKTYEVLRETDVALMKPFLLMLEEETAFSPEDAAALLQREPYANVGVRKIDLAQPDRTTIPKLTGVNGIDGAKVLAMDTTQAGKVDFIFTDTSKITKEQKASGRKTLMVRQTDGILRWGTESEIWKKKYGQPLKITI